MILFCYFQIKPIEQIAFSFPEKDALSEIDAAFNFVEADSKSEPFLVQEIAKMIAESEQVICFFDVVESEGLGALSKAIEALRKSKTNQLFFVNGKKFLWKESLGGKNVLVGIVLVERNIWLWNSPKLMDLH